MKTYLAKFTVFDGEHEHGKQLLIKAGSLQSAENKARKQEYQAWERADGKWFSYGDGTTACQCTGVEEIPMEEADILNKWGVANYLN